MVNFLNGCDFLSVIQLTIEKQTICLLFKWCAYLHIHFSKPYYFVVLTFTLNCFQDMSDLHVVPAVGRPLQLGAFYSLYDEASLGHDSLNLQNLESHVTSAPICQTQVKVFSSENFEDKAKVLGFGDGMKLSVLSNLVIFLQELS